MYRKDCVLSLNKVTLLSTIAFVAIASDVANAATVRLRKQAIVVGQHVRLGDVCTLQGFDHRDAQRLNNQVLAPAPGHGRTAIIDVADVRDTLSGLAVNMSLVCLKGASRCVVRRPVNLTGYTSKEDHTVEPVFTLRDQIINRLSQSLSAYQGTVHIDCSGIDDQLLALSTDRFQFDIGIQGQPRLGRLDIVVDVHDHDRQRLRSESLVLMVSLETTVVVASNVLVRGEIVRAEDVVAETRTVNRASQIGMRSLEDVIGMECSKAIRAGQIIRKTDIKSKPLVKRNQLIRVISNGGGIHIENVGMALEEGALGDVVEVLNESSKSRFHAKVIGLRQAVVAPAPDIQLANSKNKGSQP